MVKRGSKLDRFSGALYAQTIHPYRHPTFTETANHRLLHLSDPSHSTLRVEIVHFRKAHEVQFLFSLAMRDNAG